MMVSTDMPVLCIRNCGCRHPEKSHCLSCHRTSEKYKIKKKKVSNLEDETDHECFG